MLKSKPTKSKTFTVEDTDDDLITCTICHNEMEDARSLVCLHTYCLECLREWSKPSKNEVICPVCRESTPLQENGVDGLRRNFFVTKLKDRKAVSRQLMDKDMKITCTSCDVSDGNEAVARCMECDDFLCHGCHKAHKTLRLTKNHTVLTMVELRSGKAILLKQPTEDHCQDHPGQVLWFYCKSCDTPICRDCTVINHPTTSHELIKIDEATAGQREEIHRLVGLCMVKKEELNEISKKIYPIRCNLESTRNAVNNAIDDQKEKVKRALIVNLEKQASDLKTRVSELMRVREKAASTYEDEVQILNSRLTTALDMASHVTTDGTDCDVAYVYKQLSTTLNELRQITAPTITLGNVRFTEDASLRTSVGSIGNIEETNIANSIHRVRAESRKNSNVTQCSVCFSKIELSERKNCEHKICRHCCKLGLSRGLCGFCKISTTSDLASRKILKQKQRGKSLYPQSQLPWLCDVTCPICMEGIRNPKILSKCSHTFCAACIDNMKIKPVCPICGVVYGPLSGNQPAGTMTNYIEPTDLPGYDGYGTIVISYRFPDGLQGEDHPNPGQTFKGTARMAYLPYNIEGQRVFRLLEKAFKARLLFTIGQSVTTGEQNCVIWNDVHHKTRRTGGPKNFGYPDSGYLKRVTDELSAKGIKD